VLNVITSTSIFHYEFLTYLLYFIFFGCNVKYIYSHWFVVILWLVYCCLVMNFLFEITRNSHFTWITFFKSKKKREIFNALRYVASFLYFKDKITNINWLFLFILIQKSFIIIIIINCIIVFMIHFCFSSSFSLMH